MLSHDHTLCMCLPYPGEWAPTRGRARAYVRVHAPAHARTCAYLCTYIPTYIYLHVCTDLGVLGKKKKNHTFFHI